MFVDGVVRVQVPATSANLGPGFDSLGLALARYDELEAEILADGLEVEVLGEGAGEVPTDERHLVVRAMRAAFTAMDVQAPGLRLTCRNVIPHGRGLGSSSAAIVGGITLARGLVADGEERLDREAALRLAADLEGHPDNVAPALLGGFVIAGGAPGGWYAVNAPVAAEVSAVVFVPSIPLHTEVARGLLPEVVPHADAAANAGKAALLVAALAGRPEWLHTATADLLHQEQRGPAMPDSLALIHELRGDGVPAVVSGAGPSVLAFTDDSGAAALLRRCPDGWRAWHLSVDRVGCTLSRVLGS
ncbi:homoserine kinase [Nocardioides limicola]|uniref:homoserine kinase n=1 Tax=Nocardioides limicola TaxID=2803368 RepID=UPI00193B0BFC|nr:homoserine kinase [Nocardioides sp. DJM-14]